MSDPYILKVRNEPYAPTKFHYIVVRDVTNEGKQVTLRLYPRYSNYEPTNDEAQRWMERYNKREAVKKHLKETSKTKTAKAS